MSKKLYCIAQFEAKEGKSEVLFETLKALEPDTLREDGCVQYVVTKHTPNPFATGEAYEIVFHEIWADVASFERHCQREAIVAFFERECLSAEGLVKRYNVTTYSDE